MSSCVGCVQTRGARGPPHHNRHQQQPGHYQQQQQQQPDYYVNCDCNQCRAALQDMHCQECVIIQTKKLEIVIFMKYVSF